MPKRVLDVFWSESFWLPAGIKWDNITNGPYKNVMYPDSKDYWYQIPLILGILSSRYLLEKYCNAALGVALGLSDKKRRKPQHIPLLEVAYRRSYENKDVTALAKQLDMTERQVERWWRLRRNQDKPTNLVKFSEHMWKASHLTCSTIFSFFVLWDKDWFWDLDKCFIGYPHQGVTNDLWWFYMIYTAYICSITLTLFHDVRRKDHWQMFTHHVVTSFLVYFSWTTNLFRAGAEAMPILDAADIVLEITKAFKAAKFNRFSIIVFIFFVPTWIYTRLYLFPLFLYSTSVRGPSITGKFPAFILQNAMLFLVLILSLYWSYLILKVIINILAFGIERDIRSSCSEEFHSDANSNGNRNNRNDFDKNGLNGQTNGVAHKNDCNHNTPDHRNGIMRRT